MVDPRDGVDDRLVATLPDFDSEDLDLDGDPLDDDEDGRNDYISGVWGRYGYERQGGRSRSDAYEALVTAHKMVQNIIDTFSTAEERYLVTFDPSFSVAGTDMVGRKIVITPAPIYDSTITPGEAGVILTGMAAHEVSHPRYGKSTAAAVRRVFGTRQLPHHLSNILDDVRIERRFAQDYPGFRDVFEPTRRYVARGMIRRAGLDPDKDKLPVRLTEQTNVCAGALRYPDYFDFDTQALRDDRDWWQDWGNRSAAHDAPRRHVEAVREALRHIAAIRAAEAKRFEAARKKIEEAQAKRAAEAAAAREEYEKDAQFNRVRERLGSLNELQRRALALASKKMPGAEIAATLGLTVPEARMLLSTARRAIAQGAR